MPQAVSGLPLQRFEISRSPWLSISEYRANIIKIILAWPSVGTTYLRRLLS
jgi:hypothetical protein